MFPETAPHGVIASCGATGARRGKDTREQTGRTSPSCSRFAHDGERGLTINSAAEVEDKSRVPLAGTWLEGPAWRVLVYLFGRSPEAVEQRGRRQEAFRSPGASL